MRKLLAFDISPQILQQAVSITKPQSIRGSWHGYTRWEPLEVRLWEGGIEAYNDAYVDIDCIVCTEVYVLCLQRTLLLPNLRHYLTYAAALAS